MPEASEHCGLPSRNDFDPTRDCFDADHAWEMFGGLTVDQAFIKFMENPQYYHEDFTFMGGPAFAFYFTVIERYIDSVKVDPEEDDEVEAIWILAHSINAQLEPENRVSVAPVLARIRCLVTHVRANLADYGADHPGQDRIDSSWAELDHNLQRFEAG